MKRRRQWRLPLLLASVFALFCAGTVAWKGEAPVFTGNFSEHERISASAETDLDKTIFTDYTKTALNADYDTPEELDALEQTAGAGGRASIARARDVLEGRVRYEACREFSTREDAPNKIEQFGDMGTYTKSTLLFYYRAMDAMVTGIAGTKGEEITVYVEADAGAKLPSVVTAELFSTYQVYRDEYKLNAGKNTITLKGEDVIYLKNPYTESTQKGQVSVYFEGGLQYPVYKKGESGSAFLGYLKEYRERRKTQPQKTPDVVEFVTDGGVLTLPTEVVFTTYLDEKSITPEENAELWGNFFKQALEFNGVPLSEDSPFGEYYDERNNAIKINYRYMKFTQNIGGYATDYHIGYQEQAPWFANYNYYKNKGGGVYFFNMCHEMGHVLDNSKKTLPETTNNVTATYLYLNVLGCSANSSLQPFEKALSYLASDYQAQGVAYDDGYVLYKDPNNYDHNYLVFWELECVCPGYWGKLNNYLRRRDTFRPSNVGVRQDVEKLVYYSSLAVGSDLTDYFARWGVYLRKDKSDVFTKENATQSLKDVLEEAKKKGLIGEGKKYWYTDGSEYAFMRENGGTDDQSYRGKTPEIVSVRKEDGKRTLVLSCEKDPCHLGYEIFSSQNGRDFKAAGFTYSDVFQDENDYENSTVSYKAVAYNRYFAMSGESAVKTDAAAQSGNADVCRVNGVGYDSFGDAVAAAKAGDTVELLRDCTVKNAEIVKSLTVKVADEAAGDVTVSGENKPSYFFHIYGNGNRVSFEGREDAKIVLNGFYNSYTYPAIWLDGLDFEAKYLTVENYSASYFGGALYSKGANVTLSHCSFISCSNGSFGDGVTLENDSTLSLENCTFEGQSADLYFKTASKLVLKGETGAMKVGFGEFEGGVEVDARAASSEEDAIQKLILLNPDYAFRKKGEILEMGRVTFTLTFKAGSEQAQITVKKSRFTFGEEQLETFGKRYCKSYRDEAGNTYARGEKITLLSDMTFTVTLEEASSIFLQFFDRSEEHSFAEDADLYLPRFDGEKRIVSYTSPYQSYPAGSVFHTARKGETKLVAVYEDYFRFETTVRGKTQSQGYRKYGETITLDTLSGDFLGWYCQGNLYQGGKAIEIVRNMTFTALFNGEPIDLAKAEIVVKDCKFTGEAQEPTVVVLLDGVALSGDLYTVSYRENVDPGTAYVKIAPATQYVVGEQEAAFAIEQEQPPEKDPDEGDEKDPEPPKEDEGDEKEPAEPPKEDEGDEKDPAEPPKEQTPEKEPEAGEKRDEVEEAEEEKGGDQLLWLLAIPAVLLVGGAVAAVIVVRKKKKK